MYIAASLSRAPHTPAAGYLLYVLTGFRRIPSWLSHKPIKYATRKAIYKIFGGYLLDKVKTQEKGNSRRFR